MLMAYYGRITPFWFGSFRIVMVMSPTERMGQNGLAANAEGTSVSGMVFTIYISFIPRHAGTMFPRGSKRNPLFFLYAWLHRQEVLCPLTRKRPSILKGDTWWRGHARAFLKYVNLPAEALRQGRVCQGVHACYRRLWMVNINHPCHSDNLTLPGSTHYGHSDIVEAARGSI
nr:lipase, class 3 [Tanacetum cinerariifolium]